MVTLFVCFGILFFSVPCAGIISYPYHIKLDRGGQLALQWGVDYNRNYVLFKLAANLAKPASFGIGFSDYGEIRNADFAVFTRNTGIGYQIKDCWTDIHGVIHEDRSQDYNLLRWDEHSGHIVLEYERQFDTCDGSDYKLDNGTTHIVYFINDHTTNDVLRTDISATKNGLQRVQLLKPEVPEPKYPDDAWTFDITAPQITVPSVDTTYWWYRARLPPLPTKHHIIQYEGIIQPGNEHLVHHMEVFHCEVGPRALVREYNGPGKAEGKPPELGACRKVIGAWAMGAKAFVLPNEAGTPIGGPTASPYVLLEVHYNNPDRIRGVKDSSGIRFYVTSQLRKHDAGIMELGLEYTNKMAIPPGQHSFPLTGYCTAECTRKGLGRKIKIFGSQLHTHLTGVRVYTKHARQGIELPELNRDNHYSPHFQEIRRLVPVEVLPKDVLITTCQYNTVDRPNVTVGGFSIKDEMCVNYVHYYPWTRLEVCKSSVSTAALNRYFTFLNNLEVANTSPDKGDRGNYQSIMWSKNTAKLLSNLYSAAPISMQCNQSDGTRFPGRWEEAAKPHITEPQRKPQSTCDYKSQEFSWK